MAIRRTTTIAVADLEKVHDALTALADVSKLKQKRSPISNHDLYLLRGVRSKQRGYAGQKELLVNYFAMPKWGLATATQKAVMQIITSGDKRQMYTDINRLYRDRDAVAALTAVNPQSATLVIEEECHPILRRGAAVFQTRIYHFEIPQGENCLISGYRVE